MTDVYLIKFKREREKNYSKVASSQFFSRDVTFPNVLVNFLIGVD